MKYPDKYRHIIVPLSSGKDSQLVLQETLEDNPHEKVIPLFNDVGWDSPLVHEHLRTIEKEYNVHVRTTHGIITANGERLTNLEELIISKGMFPHQKARFCTSYLKQYATKNWLVDYYKREWDKQGKKGYHPILILFGMRRDESTQRSVKYDDFISTDVYSISDIAPRIYNRYMTRSIDVMLPIVHLSTEEVFHRIKRAGKTINPLYITQEERVGCYPCLLASRTHQERDFSTPFGKEQMCKIKRLEKIIGVKYKMYDTDQGSCEMCKI